MRAMARIALSAALLCIWAPDGARAQLDPQVLMQAVVGVEAEVPANARTARGLGTKREGSGAVIGGDGLVITVGYLILEAVATDIVLQDGRKVPADIVAYDHESGFGLLRAREDLGVPPLPLGNSADVSLQEQVIVATRGGVEEARGVYVVSRRTFAGSWEYMLDEAIYTAPAHPEFGGAALIGADGKLLGIGSLFVADAMASGRAMPGNMFVPIDLLKPILADLLDSGRRAGPYRPWLGLYPEEARGHVFISRLASGGPAERMGLAAGDLVLAVDGKPVASMVEYYRALWASGYAGDNVDLSIVSGAEFRKQTVPSIDRYEWLRLTTTY